MIRTAARLLILAAGFGLAACSNTGITTGSVAGLTKAAEPVNDITARTLQVATTSARAQRCGYHFDAARLRASFLAAEAQAGAPPPEIAKAEKAYDMVLVRVRESVAKVEDYCSDEQTGVIKADLGRHLAGDFNPRATRVVVEPIARKGPEPMDRTRIFDPSGAHGPKGGSVFD